MSEEQTDTGDPLPRITRVSVRKLALARFLSSTGGIATGVALNFSLYEQTGSAKVLALTLLLIWGLPGFLGPVAGTFGDRFDRRRVMIVCDAIGVVTWTVATVVADIPVLIIGVATLSAVLMSPFYPAVSAAIPNVAGKEHLSWANSLMSMGSSAGLTVGPLIGGVLAAVAGARWVFALNALLYLVSLLLITAVRVPFSSTERGDEEDEVRESAFENLTVGLRFIARDRVLRQLLLSFFAFLVGMAGTLVADPILSDDFGWGSLGYGLITACWGGGTIVGAWCSRNIREQREGWWIVGFSALVTVVTFGVAISPWFWLVLVLILLFGLTDGPTQVVEQNLLQRRTPDAIRSRVIGVWGMFIHIAMTVAFLIGGFLVAAVGARGAYAFAGIAGIAGTLLLIPFLKWLPERHAEEQGVR